MKRTLAFIILSYLFISPVFGGRITGTVTDEAEKNPLPFASISVKGTSRGTNANNLGQYILNLDPGNYVLICQYVGYAKIEKSITVTEADLVVDFVLPLQEKGLDEVVVRTSGDYVYEIMRNAIAKRKFYDEQLKKFSCEVYTKGILKVRSYPKKVLGQNVDFGDLDTSKQKMLYLSETISTYSVDEPDKEKIEVISSKVSGRPDAYGLSAPQFFSFYKENVSIGSRDNPLNQRGFISPLADNAISLYRFRFKGAFIEDGILINKIQVIPRRKYEPLFTGFINIVEDSWRIHSLELYLTRESQMELIDTLKIQQLYEPATKEIWTIKNQVIYPSARIAGFDAHGSFCNFYSKFNITPAFVKKDFSSTLLKYIEGANKKDDSYWESARPIRLMADEIHDYKRNDSLELAKQDKAFIDSVDRIRNKVTVFTAMLAGKTFVSTERRTTFEVQPLPEIVSFNLVEGVVVNTGFDWSKRLEKNEYSRKRITISPNLRYGFLNKHFNAHLKLKYDFGGKYNTSAMLSGGKRVFQFNNQINVGPRRNTLGTLLGERNLMLFYEAWYLRGSFMKGIGSGFAWTMAFQYQDRMPLENNSDYTWRKKDDRQFTPNYPIDLMSENIKRHQVLSFLYRLTYQPKSRYIELPEGKINLGSKYPVFNLQLEMAVKNLLSTDAEFSKWKFSVKDDMNFKLLGKFQYRLGAGGFLNAKNVQVPDYNHFNGNISNFSAEYLNSFQILPLYQFSNTEKFYFYGHVEHHFNGFITNKIPGLRQLNWHLVAAANGFYHKNANYYELSLGLENIRLAKFLPPLRVDVLQSFLNGKKWSFDFRIGIGRGNARQRDDYP